MRIILLFCSTLFLTIGCSSGPSREYRDKWIVPFGKNADTVSVTKPIEEITSKQFMDRVRNSKKPYVNTCVFTFGCKGSKSYFSSVDSFARIHSDKYDFIFVSSDPYNEIDLLVNFLAEKKIRSQIYIVNNRECNDDRFFPEQRGKQFVDSICAACVLDEQMSPCVIIFDSIKNVVVHGRAWYDALELQKKQR